MTYIDFKNKRKEYYWDDVFLFTSQIWEEENCDLALVLEMFYSADEKKTL